jgi:hypothetical protein
MRKEIEFKLFRVAEVRRIDVGAAVRSNCAHGTKRACLEDVKYGALDLFLGDRLSIGAPAASFAMMFVSLMCNLS